MSLTLIERFKQNGRYYGRYKCSCGQITTTQPHDVKIGRVVSCGCHRRKATHMITHGHTAAGANRSTYRIWAMMKDRCTNPNNKDYPDYGGRGITFGKSWLKFEKFLADMGVRPPGRYLDRKDNDGLYSKKNCTWSTPTASARNKRSNRIVRFCGREMTMAELAEKVELPYEALRRRIVDRGWSVARAASTPMMGGVVE